MGELASACEVSPFVGLLGELRRQSSRGGGLDVGRLGGWLRGQVGGDVALIGPSGGAEVSTAEFPHGVLGSLEPVLARLREGRVAVVTTQVGGVRLYLEALGTDLPRPVLVVAGSSTLAREELDLISRTGDVIMVLRRADKADRAFRSYQYKARQQRFAVFTALMEGRPDLARRMTVGAVPELLDAERQRIHLLHCAPGDRDRIAQDAQDPAGYHGPGLMVHCPVFREHLICLVPPEPHDGAGGLGTVLRSLVRDNPSYALGISGPQPLGSTAEAYAQALHALAVARNTPGRVITYRGEAPLDQALPHREAVAWARGLLHPLGECPRLTIEITRRAITFPQAGVARLLGVSRNTVAAHLTRAEKALGLDLGDLPTRSMVDLALAIAGDPQPHDGNHHRAPSPDALEELLSSSPAIAWAEAFLHPVQSSATAEDLETTIRVWIDTGTDAQQAARLLGISRNTVRTRLRTAERMLNRDLLSTGSGIHDLVHALHITRPHHTGHTSYTT